MIPVEISNVAMMDKRFILFLKAEDDERMLPIFVDEQQAQSILVQINHVEVPRPLTHDLVKVMLDQMGFRITRAEISDVKDDTFYARLHVEGNGDTFEFDARPSDALCLALRFGAEMFVDERVMETAGVVVTKAEEPVSEGDELPESDVHSEPVLNDESETELSVLDVLNKKLSVAINEERYEEAAHLRDEIQRMVKSN
jgi:uncharacterized protein